MADQFCFPLYFSSLSDLLRFNNNEDINIPSNIGTFVAVEHYRRQGCLSGKDSHQLLVLAFQKVWPAKLSKGSKPFNVRAKRFYEKALQLQHQPDRFNQFCRVDTADKASTLTFINAIASFPAEPHTEAATSNLPTTAISTVTPQALLAINVSAPPRIRGHSCDFGSSVHDRLIYAEAESPSASTVATPPLGTRTEAFFPPEDLEPLPLRLFDSPCVAFLDADVDHVDAALQADAAVLFPAGRQSCSETTPAPTSNNKKHQRCDVTRIITNLDTATHTLALSCYF